MIRLTCAHCGSLYLQPSDLADASRTPFCPTCRSARTRSPKPANKAVRSSRKKAASSVRAPGSGLAPAETYDVPPSPRSRSRKRKG